MKEQNYLDSLVGVFGHPAAENPGVVIQEAAFRDMGLSLWRYLTIDVEPDQLEDAIAGLKAFKMRGINCTLPHKINVIPYLDELSESARLIGAVNTIVNTDGKLFGENTDGKGFMESLLSNGVDPRGKKIVILGAGGAARAISVELALAGAGSNYGCQPSGGRCARAQPDGAIEKPRSADRLYPLERHIQGSPRRRYPCERDSDRAVPGCGRNPQYRRENHPSLHVCAGCNTQSGRYAVSEGCAGARRALEYRHRYADQSGGHQYRDVDRQEAGQRRDAQSA